MFRSLLTSPRRRRRAARIAAVLAIAGGVAFGAMQLPNLGENTKIKDVFEPGKPVVIGNEKTVRLTRASRRRINATLVRFVREGVARRNVGAAYDLVTPAFRGGSTRAEWRNGHSPIYAYPAPKGPVANAWHLDYSYPGYVQLALMLASRHARKVGPVIFQIELRQRWGRWLVDSFAPIATFTPIGIGRQHETGPADYAAGAPDNSNLHVDKAPLSALWIAIPAGILSLVLLVPLGFFVFGRMRARRAVRAYESTLPRSLPPLPSRRS
jgi:hypothetical protein